MTSLDLFAGAGGITLGFKKAGIKSIGAVEIDRFAAETFRYNFPDIPLYNRDIYSFSDEEILERFSGVDIIAGGPPCQGFSVAGPSQYGIIDQRNTLIMEFFRFIKALRPKICVLENVKGILSGKMNDSQKALNTYLDALEVIGYTSKVFVLQAADFGVPQYRERVVVISAQESKHIPESITGEFAGEENWVKIKDVFGDLPLIHAGEGTNDRVDYICPPLSAYQEYIRQGSTGVTNHISMKHTKRLIERFNCIPQGGSLLDAPSEHGQRQRNGSGLDVNKRYKTNNQRLHPERVSNIITASFQSTFVHPYLNRNLTAREGARLQSFPDSFHFCGPRTLMSKSLLIKENREVEIGLSQYNQIGNAVPPRMAEAIAKSILARAEVQIMTYDEMIALLTALNDAQGMRLSALPHCSNLLHQLNKREVGREGVYEQIVNLYLPTRQVRFNPNDISGYIAETTTLVNRYMDFFWPPQNNPFSHQADFISSIIPEMLCMLFGHIISAHGAALEVSAQKDLTIECIFDISSGGTIRFKNKRVDVAVVKPCQLVFNGADNELPIPLIAIECKTNLDKNMISGIEHSVNELKKTFPDCHYFVVTEVSDFDVKKSNYASSGIDEMYILRQQKRGPIRRNPEQRKPINSILVQEIAEILIHNIAAMNADVVGLETRMQNGKLIGRAL